MGRPHLCPWNGFSKTMRVAGRRGVVLLGVEVEVTSLVVLTHPPQTGMTRHRYPHQAGRVRVPLSGSSFGKKGWINQAAY